MNEPIHSEPGQHTMLDSTARLTPEEQHHDVTGNDEGKTHHLCHDLGGVAEAEQMEKLVGDMSGDSRGYHIPVGKSCKDV